MGGFEISGRAAKVRGKASGFVQDRLYIVNLSNVILTRGISWSDNLEINP
jgi:hypothetical protein